MRVLLSLLLAASVALPLSSAAQSRPVPPAMPDVLTRLEGSWRGDGIILGQPARVEMQWQPVLDGRFFRITFTSHIGPGPDARRFEGHAYYQALPAGRLRATWFDSSGLVRPITAVASADALVATWGTAETEVGETTYRIVSETAIEVVDRVQGKTGAWREFGRSTLSRTLPGR